MKDEPVRRITAFIPHEANIPHEASVPGEANVSDERAASPRPTVPVDASIPVPPRPRAVTDVLVERAYTAGMMGATISTASEALYGSEGAGSEEGAANLMLPAWFGLPRVVTILDSARKVEQFVPAVEAVVSEGLIIIDDAPDFHTVAAEDDEADDD